MRCPALRGRLALWGAALLCAAAHAVAPDTPAADAAPLRLRVVGGLAGVTQYTQLEAPFWTPRTS